MRVLILATDIYTRGGIARYTDTMATGLGQLLGPANVDLLPLLDDASRRFVPAEYRILEATTSRLTLKGKISHVVRALGCARAGYDLVVCSHVGLAPIGAAIRLRHGTPYLVVCYGSEVWERLGRIKRSALRGSRFVVSDSRFTAGVLSKVNGVPQERVRILHNAIADNLVRRLAATRSETEQKGAGNCHSEEPQATKNLFFHSSRSFAGLRMTALSGLQRDTKGADSPKRERGPVLLSVGSLNTEHAYKGVDTVIHALPAILAAVPDAGYVVVGDGDNRSNLERLAARAGVAARVTFAGEVTDAELARHYRACDVFVLPSRASVTVGASSGQPLLDGGARVMPPLSRRCEGEGFGRVYVEAALAGKPVVGSRDGGAAEAVVDGRTGLLVDPRLTQDVAAAVIGLLKSPERAAALGAEGRRWALENFTMTAMRSALAGILASVGSPAVGMISSQKAGVDTTPTFGHPSSSEEGNLVPSTGH